MKIKILFCFLLTLLFNFALFSDDQDRETHEIARVAKLLQNSATEKMEKVWPNYNLRSSPVFITFENGHIYAFNFKSSDPAWKRTHFEGMEILYTKDDKWGITNAPLQFNFEIEGQEAFVYRLDMMREPAFMPFFVLVHERFHVYQIQHFASEKRDAVSEYPESSHLDNLALMQLEEIVLLDFLKALEADSKEEIIPLLKTYISINKKRRQLISPLSQQWEARQQMVEGLADYVAAKNFDVFGYFGEKMGLKHLLFVMERYTKDDDITERALKWRHYGVGSSIGYALDYLQVSNWKKQIENEVSLQTILENNLRVSQEEAMALYKAASDKYNFSEMRKTVEQKINTYNTMLNEHMNGFKKQQGLTLNIQSPPNSGLSAGGHSKGVYSLADGTMLSVNDTSRTSSQDNFWNLELRSMPYVYQTNNGFRRFKTSLEDLEIYIDGRRHSWQQIGQKAFNTLTIKSNTCHFKSIQNPGIISVTNRELHVIFDGAPL